MVKNVAKINYEDWSFATAPKYPNASVWVYD